MSFRRNFRYGRGAGSPGTGGRRWGKDEAGGSPRESRHADGGQGHKALFIFWREVGNNRNIQTTKKGNFGTYSMELSLQMDRDLKLVEAVSECCMYHAYIFLVACLVFENLKA